MMLRRRVARLEAARGARPDPAALTALAAVLDALAARKAKGDETAQRDIEALAATLARGDLAAAEALLASAGGGGWRDGAGGHP